MWKLFRNMFTDPEFFPIIGRLVLWVWIAIVIYIAMANGCDVGKIVK